MNKLFLIACIAVLTYTAYVAADCGCLKCSKHLKIASPPSAPIKVIYRGTSCTCNKKIPYRVERPVVAPCSDPVLRHTYYRVQPMRVTKDYDTNPRSYDVKIEVPQPQQCAKKHRCLVGLIARPDRVVLPAQAAARSCEEESEECKGPGPLIETLRPCSHDDDDDDRDDTRPYHTCSCSLCSRYKQHFRCKRSNNDIDEIVDQNIRDIFFKDPIELMRFKRKEALRESLAKLFPPTKQVKLDEIPFSAHHFGRLIRGRRQLPPEYDYVVNDIQTNDIQEDDEPNLKLNDVFLDTFNWEKIIPQIPLLYFINAPIGVLSHFNRLKKHLQPAVQCVPSVWRTSQNYLHDFGRKFKRSAVSFANDFLKSFERFKRSSNNRNANHTMDVIKYKLNEDGSVDLLLHNLNATAANAQLALVLENFGGNLNDTNVYLTLVQQRTNESKRQKRGLFDLRSLFNLNSDLVGDHHHHDHDDDDQSGEDILERHLNSIPKLREHLQPKFKAAAAAIPKISPLKLQLLKATPPIKEPTYLQPENVIKEEISVILSRMQSLIKDGLDSDITINEDLMKLQKLIENLVNDWKRFHDDGKCHLVMTKRNIVHFIKELERVRAQLFKTICAHLISGNDVNRTTLIKQLVRLFKLQTIFATVVEDIGENVKLGARVHHGNEDLYWKQLETVKFFLKSDPTADIKTKRDWFLKTSMQLVEKLRHLIDSADEDEATKEEMNEMALLIQQKQNLSKLQMQTLKELNTKVRLGGNCRRELKATLNLEKQLHDIDKHLNAHNHNNNEDVVENNKTTKDAGSALKERVDEFLKTIETKRAEWNEKIEKLIK